MSGDRREMSRAVRQEIAVEPGAAFGWPTCAFTVTAVKCNRVHFIFEDAKEQQTERALSRFLFRVVQNYAGIAQASPSSPWVTTAADPDLLQTRWSERAIMAIETGVALSVFGAVLDGLALYRRLWHAVGLLPFILLSGLLLTAIVSAARRVSWPPTELLEDYAFRCGPRWVRSVSFSVGAVLACVGYLLVGPVLLQIGWDYLWEIVAQP